MASAPATTSVSVIICTRNRSQSLVETVRSIAANCVPPGWYAELVIVDNGSTDRTAQVVREAVWPNATVRYVSEPTAGQCYARNSGLRAASGEVIVFTDDDVRVPANWIEGMCAPILRGDADAVAGGVVFPPSANEAMRALPATAYRSWFASTEEIDPIKPHRMVGANMAFHRRVLAAVPAFDVELGPGALGFYDETLFCTRLLASGYRVAAAFDVAVEHHFDLSRLDVSALVDSARKLGRSEAYIYHHWDHRRSRLVTPRLLLARASLWLELIAGRPIPPAAVTERRLELEKTVAFSQELRRQRSRPPNYPPLPGRTPRG